jgi:hypothetical protein
VDKHVLDLIPLYYSKIAGVLMNVSEKCKLRSVTRSLISMRNLFLSVACVFFFAITLSGCSDSKSSGGGEVCASTDDCLVGVCDVTNNVCTDRQCDVAGSECGEGKTCSNDFLCVDSSVLTSGCTDRHDCIPDKLCIEGSCQLPGESKFCDSNEDCLVGSVCNPEGSVCESGCAENKDCDGTQSCQGGQCIAADFCTVQSCRVKGKICNTVTGNCEESAFADLCKACGNNNDCGSENDLCSALASGGSFCTQECDLAATNNCPATFTCMEAGPSTQCVPTSFSCNKCVTEGCDVGQACNSTSGECETAPGTCGECSQDYECGNGWRCADFEGSKRCLAPCVNDNCSGGDTCESVGSEQLCTPASGTCDRCAGVTCNDSEKPLCSPSSGTCVECFDTSQCSGDAVCNPSTGYCNISGCNGQSDNCPAEVPVCFVNDCVQCIDSSDCSSTQECGADYRCSALDGCSFLKCAGGGCSGGQCTTQCSSADDCVTNGLGDKCDSSNGACYFASCVDDRDCGPGGTCGGGGTGAAGGGLPIALPGVCGCEEDSHCRDGGCSLNMCLGIDLGGLGGIGGLPFP